MTRENSRTTWEKQCYGMTELQLVHMRRDARERWVTGDKMMIMSILSDAQELIEADRKEDARQHINRAKYLLHTFLKEEPITIPNS